MYQIDRWRFATQGSHIWKMAASSPYVLYEPRHDAGEHGAWQESFDVAVDEDDDSPPWRFRERMKTTSVALVLCLNVGTDPPDVVKPSPCARMECWMNPFSQNRRKSLELIGNALQSQYANLQSRAVYRQLLDPTVNVVFSHRFYSMGFGQGSSR